MSDKIKNKTRTKITDISKNPEKQLLNINIDELVPLPPPYDKPGSTPQLKQLSDEQKQKFECNFDGISVVALPKPKNKEEEEELVKKFLSGLRKLFSKKDNWTFLQPLSISMEYCGRCGVCSDECPVYLGSGKQDIYRPAYRSEVLRRIKKKYLDKGGKTLARFTDGDIDLNWTTIARLAESAHRCTLCRKCAQSCVRGVDNALITHELRKLFSQEMGIAVKELHDKGTVQQLKVGASTGINPKAFKNIVQFMEEEIEERTGKKIKIPVDKKGADFLLIHNSGEYLSWLENPEAFAIIFDAAGINWTLSSEIGGYEGTDYGVWYDDVQLARVVTQQIQAAKNLGVRKIMVGECGHAHKALIVIADRILTDETNISRESCMPILEDIVMSGKIQFDPMRNNFPVTMHDPCNMVRLMGIVEPQRRIARKLCPQFREMKDNGVHNFCCGGGSGFAIMQTMNFPSWRSAVAGRIKFKQILETFQDVISPEIPKYVCAPCSNCKGQIRDLFAFYDAYKKCNFAYGGLVELIVNAMVDIKEPYIKWEGH
ncbi:(Fe-S)-binding protein [Chloroflexota bacterium]